MLYHRIDTVKKHYPDIPIITHARAGTSYRLLKALTEKNGYVLAYDAEHTYAQEEFHRIVAVPHNQYTPSKNYGAMTRK
jgi:hypothetical protein